MCCSILDGLSVDGWNKAAQSSALLVSHRAVLRHARRQPACAQCCTAASRLYVQDSVYNEFVEKTLRTTQERWAADVDTVL